MTAGANNEEKLIHIRATHIRRTRKETRSLRKLLKQKLDGEELQNILYKVIEVWIELDEKNVITRCISGAGFVSTHECTVVRIFGGNLDIVSLVPVGNAEDKAERAEDEASDVSLSTTGPYYIFHDH